MNVKQPPEPEPSEMREQLVAYLDGELDTEATRRIEELLGSSPELSQELRQLERTWDLLDRLPKAEIDPIFTKSTIEMVALAEEAQVEEEKAAQPRRRRRARLLGGAALVVACLAGFLGINQFWPHPNEQLLQDLPVVENLEAYRQVGEIEFLRQLREAGLFTADESVAQPDAAQRDAPPTESKESSDER